MTDETRERLLKEIEVVKKEMEKTNENTTESKDEETQNTQESPESEDPYLQEAIKMGFNPNYHGANKKTPEQFVKDGSFFRKIEAQNKKIDELLGVVKNLDDHNQKVSKASYDKGIQDAMTRRGAAVESGDVVEFNRAEEEIRELVKVAPIQKPIIEEKKQDAVPQEVVDFVEENKSWLNGSTPENIRMMKEADGLLTLESQDNPNKPMKEVLEVVKEKIQRLHPEFFENPNKQKKIAITKTSSSSSSYRDSPLMGRLTDAQKNFFNSAKGLGIKLTIEEYAKQLEMTGDLRDG